MVSLDPHNRLLSRTRMDTQPVPITHSSLLRKDTSSLQALNQRRRIPAPRAIAMLLISRHPVIVSLPPSRHRSILNSWSLTYTRHLLCVPLRSRARGLQLRHAKETVFVSVAKFQDLAAVAASLGDSVERAERLSGKLITALEEVDDPGVVILAGLCEVALNATLPVCVVVTGWKPKLDVVTDTHRAAGRDGGFPVA